MSTDEYVPSEEDMREAWRAFTGPNRDHGFGAWLARVRRDAYDEGYEDAQHGEHEHRPGRKSTHPYRQEQTDG